MQELYFQNDNMSFARPVLKLAFRGDRGVSDRILVRRYTTGNLLATWQVQLAVHGAQHLRLFQ